MDIEYIHKESGKTSFVFYKDAEDYFEGMRFNFTEKDALDYVKNYQKDLKFNFDISGNILPSSILNKIDKNYLKYGK